MYSNFSTFEDLPLEGILSKTDYKNMRYMSGSLQTFFAVSGFILNALNIRTFMSMGLDNGVTVSFLGLSISDLVVSVFTIGSGLSQILLAAEYEMGPLFGIAPMVFVWVFTTASIALFVVTVLITVYLAVARCMCVVMPLQFKNVFTSYRSTVVMVLCYVFSIGVYIPVFFHTRVLPKYHPENNRTIYELYFTSEREKVKDIVFLINQMCIPIIAQIVVFVCIGIMMWKLLQSTKFRLESSSTCGSETEEDFNPKQKLSGKELQAFQQVMVISIIFILCNTPMILLAFVGALVPGFDIQAGVDRYYRIYLISHSLRRVVEQVNCSVNFFVYYAYNSTFRKHIRALF